MLRAHSSWSRALSAIKYCGKAPDSAALDDYINAEATAALDDYINAEKDDVSEISPCCSDSEDESPPAARAWVPRSACNAKLSGYNRL